uniref:Lipase domain-containing protein n=1 Tax=Felis catus TaxID=9685 RepID=A0ABI7YQA5_FELCA
MESPLCVSIFLVLCVFIQSSAHGQSLGLGPFGRRPRAAETKEASQETEIRFLLFQEETDKGCQIRLNHPDTLQQCGFNSSLPLVMIIHGWSVDGFLEDWIWQMVAALKSGMAQPVNVGLADWLTLAYHHYTMAVHNTRHVGREVAALIRWLEESVQFSRSNVHLIGYSLGAHVAGFAGSYIGGKHKIGRITGLDAAGPLFEGSSPSDRLSPDDANFVDAIHTFTREHMGLSVGIKQPIAHYDFYPNGGYFQPGCHFLQLYKHISKHGLNAITQTIKCSHERSVHLFIDSLLHASMQSTAYQCSDMGTFSQGLCLSCKKGHCNTLGYHVRQEWQGKKSKKLFLATRAQSPFKDISTKPSKDLFPTTAGLPEPSAHWENTQQRKRTGRVTQGSLLSTSIFSLAGRTLTSPGACVLLCLFVCSFLFERERKKSTGAHSSRGETRSWRGEQREGERERERRENPKHRAQCGAQFHNPGIMT